MFIFFNLIYILIFPFFALHMALKDKWHDGMGFRLGRIPESFRKQLSDKPKIWIHAVSAGEVLAVVEFIKRLAVEYPGHQIICSTVTQTGFELASAQLKQTALVMYAPIDFSWVVKKFVDVIRPRVYISAETEFWPNLYCCLAQRDIRLVLINGRISDQSFKNYQLGRCLLGPTLKAVSVFAMQTEEDARRVMALGVEPGRVQVAGNLKFDTVNLGRTDHAYEDWKDDRIFLAGSTHPGEEEIVIEAFQKLKQSFPDLRLMIAPRHVERADNVARLLAHRGFPTVRLSSVGRSWARDAVMVVDRMGKLRDLYQAATVVFVGKTFKVGGGQNMIEPLAFGKPTFVGPLTQNFKDVMAIFLKAGVITRVDQPGRLAGEIIKILNDPAAVENIRVSAPQVIRSHQGATEKLMGVMKS